MCERECVYVCVCEEETDLILVSGCVHLNVQTYYIEREVKDGCVFTACVYIYSCHLSMHDQLHVHVHV